VILFCKPTLLDIQNGWSKNICYESVHPETGIPFIIDFCLFLQQHNKKIPKNIVTSRILDL